MRRLLCALPLLVGCGDNRDAHMGLCTVGGEPLSVFVFTRENMWLHDSNLVAAEALKDLAVRRGWRIVVTDDPTEVTDKALLRSDVMIFSVTSGPVLDAEQRALVEPYFRAGLGYVGFHSASATESDWAFYREMVPVTFLTHPLDPRLLEMKINMLADDPIVGDTPNPWTTIDEFYTFNERPENIEGLNLLYALDETSNPIYPSNVAVGFHPLAFTTERTGNRAFYTALGHTPEQYSSPEFMGMLERAILWAGEKRHAQRCADD